MDISLKPWGNSLGIRIPGNVIKEMGLKKDDQLDLVVLDGKIVIEKVKRHKSLEERMAVYGNKLELLGEYDWGDPVGRELW